MTGRRSPAGGRRNRRGSHSANALPSPDGTRSTRNSGGSPTGHGSRSAKENPAGGGPTGGGLSEIADRQAGSTDPRPPCPRLPQASGPALRLGSRRRGPPARSAALRGAARARHGLSALESGDKPAPPPVAAQLSSCRFGRPWPRAKRQPRRLRAGGAREPLSSRAGPRATGATCRPRPPSRAGRCGRAASARRTPARRS